MATPGLFWDASRLYTDGSLSVVAPLSADFNVDGDVDSADLAAWRAGFGLATATQGQGAANGDSRADGADFLVWHRQFGSHFFPGSVAPVTVTVPEPAALQRSTRYFAAWLRRR